jgi:membrane protease YdiL (CAAX protease family)
LATSTPPELPPVLVGTEPAASGSVSELPVVSTLGASSTVPPTFVASETGVPVWMWITVGVSGVVLAWLSFIVGGYNRAYPDVAYRIGAMMGGLCVWPLVVIGLFSIGRRFRTPRNRAIILLVVWGISIMGQLTNINVHNRVRARARPAPAEGGEDDAGASFLNRRETTAPAARPAPKVAEAAKSELLDFDFSKGSDQRLIKLMESAQEDRYRAIVDGYASACERRPNDAALALERVRFIERFAESEDTPIKDADHDLDRALDYLTTRFPRAPGAVLYKLQRLVGPPFEAEAKRHAQAVVSWPRADRASFFLLRAQRTEDQAQQLTLARLSFEAEPTATAGLLLLERLPKAPPTAETMRVAQHPVFQSTRPWQKLQVMNVLFDIAQTARAMELYQEIRAAAPMLVQTPEMATRLAAAGDVAAGRTLLTGLPVRGWNRARVLRERFRFELKHGTGEQALAAYRALRGSGMAADPFLRDRVALLMKHPMLGWNFQDAGGLAMGGLLLIALLLTPAVILLPVHYWSLLRERRAKPSAWPGARWGLREAWAALGAYLAVEVFCVWWFQPEIMRGWWQKNQLEQQNATFTDGMLLAQQTTAWAALAVVLGLALWRARAWRVIGRGEWSWGRTVGLALAGTMILRIALLSYTAVWPEAIEGEVASLSPNTRQLCLALLKGGGPGVLILVVAGFVPLVEELLFRGVLLEALAKHIPFWWANVGQALLFASVHENYRLLPFFLAFGVVCGVLARRSQALLAPMAVHSLNNLTVCFVLMATNR